jgi:hypothetical protein
MVTTGTGTQAGGEKLLTKNRNRGHLGGGVVSLAGFSNFENRCLDDIHPLDKKAPSIAGTETLVEKGSHV